MRRAEKAQSEGRPLPPYEPQATLHRVRPRLNVENLSPQLDVDESFSPEPSEQPMSISTAAVTGHHGLETSRMLEDFDSAKMVDHDDAAGPEVIYAE